MICERCKRNEAEEYKIETSDGKFKKKYLCSQCFNEELKAQSIDSLIGLFSRQLLRMLRQCVKLKVCEFLNTTDTCYPIRCEICGLTWLQYKRMKSPSCPLCYDSFRKIALKINNFDSDVWHYSQINGSSHYLHQAISTEQFERTFRCLDWIRKIKRVNDGAVG